MKNEKTNYAPKQMRLAEGGVLFVLVLGLTIFGGVKLASRGGDETTVAEPVVVEAIEESGEVTDGVGDITDDVAVEISSEFTEADVESPTVEPTPSPRVVTYAMAEAAFFEGRYEEAAGLFADYTGEHPQNAWGHYMEGLSLSRDGCPEAAEEAFNEALTLQPEHVKSLVNLGRVLIDLERPDEALPLVEKAIAVDETNRDAYRVLGRIYHNLQRRGEAIEAYEQVLRLDPEDAWSLNNLGLLHIEADRCDDALAPLARAVELRQDVACFLNNLGIALERNGYPRQAAVAYAEALAADPTHARAEVSLDRVAKVDAPANDVIDLAALATDFAATFTASAAADTAAIDSAAESTVLVAEDTPAEEVATVAVVDDLPPEVR